MDMQKNLLQNEENSWLFIPYFLYQGVDNTVRTLTIEISFDGTEKNARLYKFVIDPANYTLLNAE